LHLPYIPSRDRKGAETTDDVPLQTAPSRSRLGKGTDTLITHHALPRRAGARSAHPDAISRAVATTNPPWVSSAYPDSRAFAELAVTVSRPGERALDVGTGSGVVAICLARAGCHVTATDVSAAAVRNAERNALRNGVQITCEVSDLLDSVDERFDLITINPPYSFVRDTFLGNVAKNLLRRVPAVHRSSGSAMPGAVRRFRLAMMRRFFEQAPTRLRRGGRLLLLVYRHEVDALNESLPAGTNVQRLAHGDLETIGAVGLLINPAPGSTTGGRPAARSE